MELQIVCLSMIIPTMTRNLRDIQVEKLFLYVVHGDKNSQMEI